MKAKCLNGLELNNMTTEELQRFQMISDNTSNAEWLARGIVVGLFIFIVFLAYYISPENNPCLHHNKHVQTYCEANR